MIAREYNFDGLVGPTHNYAGLSFGNVASTGHALTVSRPREAALQGLAKMKALWELGLGQGVLPPQERPDVHTLRRLGFTGSDPQIVERAARQAPELLRACCSASSMRTANAATVSPGADTEDGRVHFTSANLVSKFHRTIEPATTGRILQALFPPGDHFAHHRPLPGGEALGDEGAANHTRLCRSFGERGVELFVYGRRAFGAGPVPVRFPARQTLEASQAVARLHGLDPRCTVFAQQDPETIDRGVFHNDVIAVGNGNVLLYHRRAFLDGPATLERLRRAYGCGELWLVEVDDHWVTVDEAVASYLFNSQLVTLPDGSPALSAGVYCGEPPGVRRCLEEIVAGPSPIERVHYLDVRESMKNGGGPACLRLRVVLSDAERAGANQAVFLDQTLYQRLVEWVKRHYREQLTGDDLADPRLLEESRTALDELTGLLNLGAVYPFQRERMDK
ncbi:MAG: N-succinylarginine dihydrolase [Candidatus Competibacteraceae bacterium]|nr:N-succinylarginine dihydrolase [Candidatus Competibacteraceae bacterium]